MTLYSLWEQLRAPVLELCSEARQHGREGDWQRETTFCKPGAPNVTDLLLSLIISVWGSDGVSASIDPSRVILYDTKHSPLNNNSARQLIYKLYVTALRNGRTLLVILHFPFDYLVDR